MQFFGEFFPRPQTDELDLDVAIGRIEATSQAKDLLILRMPSRRKELSPFPWQFNLYRLQLHHTDNGNPAQVLERKFVPIALDTIQQFLTDRNAGEETRKQIKGQNKGLIWGGVLITLLLGTFEALLHWLKL